MSSGEVRRCGRSMRNRVPRDVRRACPVTDVPLFLDMPSGDDQWKRYLKNADLTLLIDALEALPKESSRQDRDQNGEGPLKPG